METTIGTLKNMVGKISKIIVTTHLPGYKNKVSLNFVVNQLANHNFTV